jgi:hypothetical protein
MEGRKREMPGSVFFCPLPRPKLVYKIGWWRVPSFLSVSFDQVGFRKDF